MSGVFLTVEDNDGILPVVKDMFPHITLFYSGKLLTMDELAEIRHAIVQEIMDQKFVLTSIEHDVVKKDDKKFYYVKLSVENSEPIEHLRKELKEKFPKLENEKVFMRSPHVTVAIRETKEERDQEIEKWEQELPIHVRVVDITLD